MAIIDDLKILVECESPTDDLTACQRVVELAAQIAKRVTNKEARIINEKIGRAHV